MASGFGCRSFWSAARRCRSLLSRWLARNQPLERPQYKGAPHLYVVGDEQSAGETPVPHSLLRTPTPPHSNRRILP